MTLKLILLLLLISCTISLQSCLIYNCFDDPADVCATTDKNIVSLRPCHSPKICDFGVGANGSYCKDYIKSRYPGEYCKDNEECLKGECTSNHCKVKNEECTTDLDCSPQYFCDENKCKPTAKLNEKCGQTKKCDAGLVCGDETCVKIGNLGVNMTTNSPAACSTLHKRGKFCAEGPKLVTNKSLELTKCESDCKYVYPDKTTFYSGCSCELNSQPSLICNPGIADINIEDVFSLLNP